MPDSEDTMNEPVAPSTAPDFNSAYRKAQVTGDFDFVLDTAKKSHKMLIDFRDSVRSAKFPGADSQSVALGLNFLEQMIASAAAQLAALKNSEKQTTAALKAKANGVAGNA